jgi:hypothetical protein
MLGRRYWKVVNGECGLIDVGKNSAAPSSAGAPRSASLQGNADLLPSPRSTNTSWPGRRIV